MTLSLFGGNFSESLALIKALVHAIVVVVLILVIGVIVVRIRLSNLVNYDLDELDSLAYSRVMTHPHNGSSATPTSCLEYNVNEGPEEVGEESHELNVEPGLPQWFVDVDALELVANLFLVDDFQQPVEDSHLVDRNGDNLEEVVNMGLSGDILEELGSYKA